MKEDGWKVIKAEDDEAIRINSFYEKQFDEEEDKKKAELLAGLIKAREEFEKILVLK